MGNPAFFQIQQLSLDRGRAHVNDNGVIVLGGVPGFDIDEFKSPGIVGQGDGNFPVRLPQHPAQAPKQVEIRRNVIVFIRPLDFPHQATEIAHVVVRRWRRQFQVAFENRRIDSQTLDQGIQVAGFENMALATGFTFQGGIVNA